ncbi:MAG: hypothetical protein HOV66_09875 [Streptomycetaceae bacterium]|nr:hypothetical protein [Streptomycetaceae bacterium]
MLSPETLAAAIDDDGDAIDDIATLAATHPHEVAPHLPRLLDAGVLWPPRIYRPLDEESQRALVARIDAGTDPMAAGYLDILAFARGADAERAFRRWRDEPPPGCAAAAVEQSTIDAGWLVTGDGIRELQAAVAYALVPGDGDAPVDDDAHCPWCAAPLWVALDIDTGADDRVAAALAHTGWSGRLRVTPCLVCSCVGPSFFRVASDGGAAWSPHTRKPDWYTPGPPERPGAVPLTVGPARATAHGASAWGKGGSTLGGSPDWIQDPHDMRCPECGAPMSYVGLVGGADLGEYGEGAWYVFLHAPCGLAAVEYEQS